MIQADHQCSTERNGHPGTAIENHSARANPRALDDAFAKGIKTAADGTKTFSPEAVMKELGLTQKASGRTKAYETLLAKAGGANLSEVKDILLTAQQLRNLEIPNVSTFIARRGTIGGLRSIVRGMTPGMFLHTGAGVAGHAAMGPIGGLVGMAMFVGGTRAISRALADPLAFKSLREAARPEVHRIQRRVNVLRFSRLMVNAAVEDGMFSFDVGQEIKDGLRDGILDLEARGFLKRPE